MSVGYGKARLWKPLVLLPKKLHNKSVVFNFLVIEQNLLALTHLADKISVQYPH